MCVYVCTYAYMFYISIYVYMINRLCLKKTLPANAGAVLDMLPERAVNSSIVKWSPNVEDCGNSRVNKLDFGVR